MASAQFGVFEEHQKRALRKILIEERSRYCFLLNLFQPVVVSSDILNQVCQFCFFDVQILAFT